MTNRDRLNAMSNDELAEFLCWYDACSLCPNEVRRVCNSRDCNEIGLTKRWLDSEEEKGRAV